MTKLSDTQAILLSAAAQRADGNLLPLPGSLRGGAAVKVVGALLTRGLAREDVTDLQTRADSALNTIWRNEDDGRAVLLRITPTGLAAIGVEPEAAPPASRWRNPQPERRRRSAAGRRRRPRRPRRLRPPRRARPAPIPSRRS